MVFPSCRFVLSDAADRILKAKIERVFASFDKRVVNVRTVQRSGQVDLFRLLIS